jgi:hypothetical protein
VSKINTAAKRGIAKPPSAATQPDLRGAFAALRAILVKHAPKLKIVHDTPTKYYLDTHFIGKKNKAPIFFGAAIINKNYVSFHLMPVYTSPAIAKQISPQLKKRMQGKACFNFTAPDLELIAELDRLTSESIDPYLKYIQSLA